MGLYAILPELPAAPGLEGMGRIEALGEGVTGFQPGQRVIPMGVTSGTWQKYIIANPAQLLPVPDAVSDQTAAQFVVNPVTAWAMLDELDLSAGDWVLQTGAGSTLGRLILQIAQLKGYKTINFVRRREQVQELLDLGADAVICTEDDNVVAQVMELTGGEGVAGAVDAAAGPVGGLAASCLGNGGTMLAYGLLSGEATPINAAELFFKGTTVRGFWISTWFNNTPPAKVNSVLTELMQLMVEGHLLPPVEAEYDLADIHQAVAHAGQSGRSGKVILTG
jgi:NADPH2:quinone reductase